MSEQLAIFRLAGETARHAGARQSLIAQNVANADTPGYAAREMPRFADIYTGGLQGEMRTTRPEHMTGGAGLSGPRPTDTLSEPAPNGNTVSVEDEMLAAVDAAREHSRALAIYRHGLTVMRNVLGRS